MGVKPVNINLETGEYQFGIPIATWKRCKIVSPDYIGLSDPYYEKVQEAINACPLDMGYQVIVLPGNYSEELTMRSGIHLHMMAGAVVSATGANPVFKALTLTNEIIVSGKGVFSSAVALQFGTAVVHFEALRVEGSVGLLSGSEVNIQVDEIRFTTAIYGSAKGKIKANKCGNIISGGLYTGKMFFDIEEIEGSVTSNAGEMTIDFQEMLGEVVMIQGTLVMRNGHINRGGDTTHVVMYSNGDMRFEDVRIKHLTTTGDAIRYSMGAVGARVFLKNCVLISATYSVNNPAGGSAFVNLYSSVANSSLNYVTARVEPLVVSPNVD